jgi:Chitobiase/beta-hexosaminidase C-terminal domain/Lamin Tail Domain/CotH kinase protein/Bacterial TSP3 repeat
MDINIRRMTRLILAVLGLTFALLAAPADAALIFSTNANWRLFKGRTEASTPDPTAWRGVNFNDSAFTDAPAPFWYDATGDTSTLSGGTRLTDMQNVYTCLFLRRSFVLTNITEFSALRFGALIDDGYVVWINGAEVQRVNVGTPGSAVSISTLATGATEPAPFVFSDLLNPSSYLTLGTNVIAVQVFNTTLASSDLDFDCSLSTTAPDLIPPTIVTRTPAPGQISALSSITIAFNEPVQGISASDLLINGLAASSMTGGNDTYTFNFAQPAYGNVNISWVAGHGILDFGVPPNAFNATGPGATWQYSLVDNIAPTVAFQLPFAGVTVRNLTQIEVDFTESVTGVDASDLLINNVPADTVAALAPNRYVFTFAQPSVGSVQVRFADAHGIHDLAAAPNDFAGAGWSYVLDPNAVVNSVRINELAAANVNGLRDEDNEVVDWVELYNTGNSVVSLAGWSLTDNEDEPAKWVFPPVSIAARGYLIVYCSGKDRKPITPGSKLHSNFSLSPDGEFLGLYNAEVPRQLVSSFNPYPNQRTDYSYGYDPQDQLKYFQTETPGASNGVSTITGVVGDTKFSHKRGFYTTPFSLSITCATPGVTIRYTTNGTAPTATTGLIYSSPISIGATKVVRAAAYKTGLLPSDVDAQTYLFLDDIIHQPDGAAPAAGWPAPRTSGGQIWDYGMDPQIVNVAPYAATIKDDLKAIPTYSIVMDLAQFVDIYNNPGGDTITWERPASLELIYPDDTEGFQANCGVRIRGGFSRDPSNPKHAFRIFFRQEYGASKLNYPVFGPTGAKEFDKFDIRTMQNYSWAYQNDPRMICVRDVMSRDAQLAMNGFGTRGNFYHLYINGVYWGLYNTEERPEAAFAESYIGGRAEDYDTIKQLDGYISGATDGNEAAWYRLWQAATNGFANDVDYFKVQGLNVDGTPNPAYENLVDVPNMIDYMLVILYGGNLDAPISNFLGNDSPNNWYGVRNRTGQFGGFRFFAHDSEHTLLNVSEDRTGIIDLANTTPANTYGVINPDWTCGNPLTQSGGAAQAIIRSTPQYIWFRMIPNAEFRMLVADRTQKHCFNGGPLSVQGMLSAFLTRSNELNRAIVGESARWGDAKSATPYTRETWLSAMRTTVSGFINGRTTVLINQLKADGLYPNVNPPSFNNNGGAVPAGFAVFLTNNAAGAQVFYTTDGRDPRLRGGNVSPSAINYTPGTPLLINFPVTIRARARVGSTWSALVEATFYPAQDFANLLITEIMYNPPGLGATTGDEFEFLELKNAGTNVIDLSGATFDGITFSFTNGTRLGPGQFFVLGRNRTTLGSRYPGLTVNGLYTGKLDNGGETITLLHPLGTRILSVDYKDSGKWPITPDGFGFSLVPKNPSANPNPDSPSNWRASTNPGGSPGEDDPSPTVAGILVNESLTHTDLPAVDWIELYNPTAADVNIGGWFLTDDGKTPMKFRIQDNTMIAAGGYIVFDESNFNPTPGTNNSFTLSSQGEEVYLFSGDANTNLTGYSHGFTFGAAANDVSFGRHIISTGDERFVAQIANTPLAANSGPLVGPVVIREIMYHPPDLANGLDNADDEYIELRNITSSMVQLFDALHPTNTWRVRGGVDFDFPQSVSIGAAQSIVLVSFDPTNTAALAAFRAGHGLFAGVPILGPYSGKLDNSSDTISLRKPDAPDTNGVAYIVVDEVDYKDSAPWPPSADGAGAALQRVNLAAYADDPANWVGAAPLSITSLAPMLIAVRAGTNAATATNVTFTVSAIGTGVLKYQWRKNGADIPGATNDSFTITNVQLPDEAAYMVVVSDLAGSVQSAPANLFVYLVASLSVAQFPATQSVVSGGRITLSATLAGSPPPFTNEWRLLSPSPTITNIQVRFDRTTFFTYTAPVLINSLAVTQQWRFVVKSIGTPANGFSPGTFSLIILPDTDGDGIPDQWEIANGFSPTNAGDSLLDTDGDGMNNRDEYIAGTNPTNAASCLKFTQISVSSPAQITFEAVSNKTYSVQYREDLAGAPWLNLTSIVARTNTHFETVLDPNPVTNRFYRIATPQVP